MSELHRIIIDVAERGKNDLPDRFIYDEGYRYTVDKLIQEIDLEKFIRGVNSMADELKLIEQEMVNHPYGNTLLAARIVAHDFLKLQSDLKAAVQIYQVSGKKEDFESILALSTKYRSYLMTMGYLASNGDKQFLANIPVEDMGNILFRFEKESKYEVDITDNAPEHIAVSEIVAIDQIARNAPANFIIYIGSNDDYYIFSVNDEGFGIIDKKGHPLPLKDIHRIFNGFSTKKRSVPKPGFGLQLVNALAELRGGYVKVMTTTPGNPCIGYDTKDKTASVITPGLEMGSQFDLYIPK